MALDDDIQLLRNLDLFSSFPDDALRLIIFAAERLNVDEQSSLFMKGEQSTCGYLVESGLIGLYHDLDEPPFEMAERGTLIGEMALITESARPAHARAEKNTSLIVLKRSMMHRLLKEYPGSALIILERVNRRSVALYQALKRLESNNPLFRAEL